MNRLTKPIEGIETMTTEQIMGASIKQLRENIGMSQKRLARRSKTSETTVQRIESGLGTTIAVGERIAHALGAELCELL